MRWPLPAAVIKAIVFKINPFREKDQGPQGGVKSMDLKTLESLNPLFLVEVDYKPSSVPLP